MIFTSGPVAKIPETAMHREKAFLTDVVARCRRMAVDVIGQPKTTAIFNACPDGAVCIPWGCYQADLLRSEDELFSRLHAGRRRVIRKAQRDGIRISRGPENIAACHGLIAWTLERQGRPGIPHAQLTAYQEYLPLNLSFYLARHNRSDQACAVLIHDSQTAYYIHGGSCARPHHGAASLLHWTAMLDMKGRGLKTYNFVGGRIRPARGSKQEGIQVFKSRFGTTFKSGYLWKYPLVPWRYNLYRTWSRLKGLGRAGYFCEDIIDNELRTAGMEKSALIDNCMET